MPAFAQSSQFSIEAGANIEAGAKVFRLCMSCHMVGDKAKNRTGPILNDLFGRPAASVKDYKRYSDAMIRAGAGGLVWDLDHINWYIENPKSLVSGTRMIFKGVKDPIDRSNLIEYLRQFSDNPANIVEAEPTILATDPDVHPSILAIVGDPAYGEYLSGECVTCHQIDGEVDGIPSIIGWNEEDFVIALQAYKTEHRTHEVMIMTARRLSDEEIAALATYFKTLGD